MKGDSKGAKELESDKAASGKPPLCAQSTVAGAQGLIEDKPGCSGLWLPCQPLPGRADLELKVPGRGESLLLLVGEEFPLGSEEICSPGLIERCLSAAGEITSHSLHSSWVRSGRERKFLAGMEPREAQGTPGCISKERETFCCR